MVDEMTFGTYIRHRRHLRKWSLGKLAEEAGLSYSHLSRLENDSTAPKAETVAVLAGALDGDLKQMLVLANCLPQSILDRMVAVREGGSPLRRAADRRRPGEVADRELSQAQSLAGALGVPPDEANAAAGAVVQFLRLGSRQRQALTRLIESIGTGEDGT